MIMQSSILKSFHEGFWLDLNIWIIFGKNRSAWWWGSILIAILVAEKWEESFSKWKVTKVVLMNNFFWLPTTNSKFICSFHFIDWRNWDTLDREAGMHGKYLWKVYSSRCSDQNKEKDEAQSRDSGNSRIQQCRCIEQMPLHIPGHILTQRA